MPNEHGHLKRLRRVGERQPTYFITTCVNGRRALLANETAHNILRQEWQESLVRHGWAVGRYVVMPDHVHFFIMPSPTMPCALSVVVGKWKEWTAKRLLRELGGSAPLWQPEFFDHLLRSNESRREKWVYVRENPVRAGLVARAEDWPYAGSIDFE
ncbi:MAG TPA: transposase [Opitutaceae bacterium]|nr:transposase [Opitutaceae bacterium]